MNVLSIGNSFSSDAQRYLHRIAAADGVEINCINLYIGGCTLERHHRFMKSEGKEYVLEVNGEHSFFNVSLKQALLNRNWQFITFQQRSAYSVDYDTYQPYLCKLSEYVRDLCPKAKQLIHQTWSYEEGNGYMRDIGFESSDAMFEKIEAAYNKAAEDIKADMLIPSGKLFNTLYHKGVGPLHRDGCHASNGLGRYAIALLWYAMLTGNDVTDNSFCHFDEPVSEKDINITKETVKNLL